MAPNEIVIEVNVTEMLRARTAYRAAWVAALVALCVQAAILTFLSVAVWRYYEGLPGAIFVGGALFCQGIAFAYTYRDLQAKRRRIAEAWQEIVKQIAPAFFEGKQP